MTKFEAYIFDLDGTLVQIKKNYSILIDRGDAKLPKNINPRRTIKSLTELIEN